SVGSRKNYHTDIGSETIHFHQKLVEGIFTFVVSTHDGVFATSATNSIDFIDKNDTRCLFLSLFKQVTYPRGAHTHKHLHKIRARQGEERHLCLTRYCFREQSLTRSGRAHQKCPFRNFSTQIGVFFWVF